MKRTDIISAGIIIAAILLGGYYLLRHPEIADLDEPGYTQERKAR